MAPERNVLKRIDLTDNQYTIKQKLFRNRYTVYDTAGNVVLKTKQKLFKVKEEFPFLDADGDPVFTVKAQNVLDIAGDYTITDAETGDPVAVLGKQFSLFVHKWQVKTPDGNMQAVIRSKSKLLCVLRSVSGIINFVPHSYVIETPDGERIGQIKGRFSLRDTYDLSIDHAGDMPKEALLAAAIAVDALEGN